MHEKRHLGAVLDPRFYENDYQVGKDGELEFVRSPFYDLAKAEQFKNSEDAAKIIDDVTFKMN